MLKQLEKLVSLPQFCAAVLIAMIATNVAAEETRDYSLGDFDRIDAAAGVAVICEVGAEQRVVAATKNGDFSDLRVEVRGGELRVTRRHNKLSWHAKKSDYEVRVSAPSIRAVSVSSGAFAKVSNIRGSSFMVDASSGGRANVSGSASACVIDLSSGAQINGADLSCDNATIDVSSGGRGSLTVTQGLVADASSGGSVKVYGEPAAVMVDKSSGGRIYIASSGSR